MIGKKIKKQSIIRIAQQFELLLRCLLINVLIRMRTMNGVIVLYVTLYFITKVLSISNRFYGWFEINFKNTF